MGGACRGSLMPKSDCKAAQYLNVLGSGGLLTTILLSTASFAGGYDTGERDWDFLFQQQEFAIEARMLYINPQRKLKNVTNTVLPGTTAKVKETGAFSVQRYSAAVRFGQNAACMGTYREPWAGFANYGTAWVGAGSAVEQKFFSKDIGLTCSLSASLGRGNWSVLAGLSRQEIEYELIQSAGIAGLRTTLVKDSGYGWRAGIAYEIPEYALRASLIYNSKVDYNMTGNVSIPAVVTTPIVGAITMPQSLELRAQSGVAPGWLVFGSVKWTNWNVTDNMPLCAATTLNCTQAAALSGLTLLWKDSWTTTLGAARQLDDRFTLAGNITWDQGASQGFTSQTDTWTTGLTMVFTPNRNLEFKLGGTMGIMTGGTVSTAGLPGGIPNPVGYTAEFGNDLLYTLNASIIARF